MISRANKQNKKHPSRSWDKNKNKWMEWNRLLSPSITWSALWRVKYLRFLRKFKLNRSCRLLIPRNLRMLRRLSSASSLHPKKQIKTKDQKPRQRKNLSWKKEKNLQECSSTWMKNNKPKRLEVRRIISKNWPHSSTIPSNLSHLSIEAVFLSILSPQSSLKFSTPMKFLSKSSPLSRQA